MINKHIVMIGLFLVLIVSGCIAGNGNLNNTPKAATHCSLLEINNSGNAYLGSVSEPVTYCYSSEEINDYNEAISLSGELTPEQRRFSHGIRTDVETSYLYGVTMNNLIEIPEEQYLTSEVLQRDYTMVGQRTVGDGERLVSLKFILPSETEQDFTVSEIQCFIKNYMIKRNRYFNLDFDKIEFGTPEYHEWDNAWEIGIKRKNEQDVAISTSAQFKVSRYGTIYHFSAYQESIGLLFTVPNVSIPLKPKISRYEAENIAKQQEEIPNPTIVESAELRLVTSWPKDNCIQYNLQWVVDFACSEHAEYDKIIIDAYDGSVVRKSFKCYVT